MRTLPLVTPLVLLRYDWPLAPEIARRTSLVAMCRQAKPDKTVNDEEETMLLMYHATTVDRGKQILKKGLRPKGAARTSPHSDQHFVFAFSGLRKAASYANALAEKYHKETVIIIIDGDGIEWMADPCWDITHSYVTTSAIPPDKILDAQRW